MKMRKDEEVIELFYHDLEGLEKQYGQKATVTVNGAWVTIKFGTWETVTARGYLNALLALDQVLPEHIWRKQLEDEEIARQKALDELQSQMRD